MEMPIITMQQNKGVTLYQVTQGAQLKATTYREDVTAPLIYPQFTRLSVTYCNTSTDVMPTFLICVNLACVPTFHNLPLSRYLATIS